MEYVDRKFYDEVFHGEPVSETDFPSLLMRASEIVEEFTLYRLTPTSFLVMSEDTQECVRKAVCAQIEYLDANGEAELDNGAGLSGATLGKFSYSGASSAASGSTEQSKISPRVERLLWPTGLTYRGGRII